MKRRRYRTESALTVTALVLAATLTPSIAAAQQTTRGTRDWSAVDQAFGRKAAAQPGG